MQHVKRWLTALFLGPLILWILVKGSIMLVGMLLAVVSFLSMREYLRIIFPDPQAPVSRTITAISHAVSMLLVVAACMGSWEVLFLILSLNLMALSIFVLARFATDHAVFNSISRQVLGIVYIPVPLCLLVFIRQLPGGTLWIIWLLIVIFANDTGAFYSGRFFGKRFLAPNISPKKTIEGSIGGIIVSMTAGFIFCQIFFHDTSLSFLALPGAFMLAAAGQIGDLFESAMKRVSQIKDSGRILPGHGGMLDRIDGLLPAIPVLYAYLAFVL